MNRVRQKARRGRRGRYLIAGAIACCLAVGLLGLQLQSSQKKPLAPLLSSSKEYVLKLNGAIAPSSAYYDRTMPLIARSIDDKSSLDLISHFMDMQRRLLRPFGARFGELDLRRLKVLQAQLLQRRIIQQPVDFARAVNYDILTEAYRTEANAFTQIEL